MKAAVRTKAQLRGVRREIEEYKAGTRKTLTKAAILYIARETADAYAAGIVRDWAELREAMTPQRLIRYAEQTTTVGAFSCFPHYVSGLWHSYAGRRAARAVRKLVAEGRLS